MPCYHPLQATYSVRPDGKKNIKFSSGNARLFHYGVEKLSENNLSLPCGRCMGCRVERSRQWAVRIMHEAQLYEENCFITLTFDDKHLSEMCPTGSLDRKHMQNFMKRLRQKFDGRRIRAFYCGEYGDNFARPHYHACLFNISFEDRKFWRKVGDFPYYNSDVLASVWPYGFSVISDLTFDSAAYVARYCTKKITGSMAEDHYKGRLPEFSQASLKPGIGADWLSKFGVSDCFNHDAIVSKGVICKPPRYYDKRLERDNPDLFAKHRANREARALLKADDNTYRRLLVKEACHASRMKKLMRNLDKGNL